jgi:hypothetical protein
MIKPNFTIDWEDKSQALSRRTYFIPSIPPSVTSEEMALKLTPIGTISALIINCNSSNYDIHLTNREGVSVDSSSVLYSLTSINRLHGISPSDTVRISPNELNLLYNNEDQPQQPYLYLTVVNNDTVETGLITLKLSIKEN